jgi:hypothetical protein
MRAASNIVNGYDMVAAVSESSGECPDQNACMNIQALVSHQTNIAMAGDLTLNCLETDACIICRVTRLPEAD